ncbi:MAG: TetR/AcrR family transcriptional regulator [Pseudomonadota bacterium]|nr:TetR/AcrR family transcriptional regulator [Pseudomonadota bacterium]
MKITAKQKDILDAAEKEFLKHGLHNAVIDQIVENANVSKRTLYKYYRSKLDLFQAVLMQKYRAVGRATPIKYNKDQDFKTQLKNQILNEINTYQSVAYRDVAQMILRELMLSQDKAEKVFAQLPPTGASIAVWLDAAVRDGYIACSDVQMAAESLEAHIKAFAFYPQVFGLAALSEARSAQIADHLVDVICKTYDYAGA